MGCYHCGDLGHIKRNCPQLFSTSGAGQGSESQQYQRGSKTQTQGRPVISTGNNVSGNKFTSQSTRPPTQARVFAMTQQEVVHFHDVVIGMLSIFDRDAHIIIDLVSTHSLCVI